ncbi:MSMEG_0570 family nitrogen starvation response protein [Actinoplanes sp. NPDC026619]|uniref:MSMEG_0570 family nitrogen starvation response protein n=1 Tax=Actinoplanes sp. NPDC026619 TaxID=3155798 RepID=UPI0033F714BC
MPERYVSVRWPDGQAQEIYSPSTVIEDWFHAGQTLPVAEFVIRSRAALSIASDRVKAAYGFPCSRAAASIAAVSAHAENQEGDVIVERIAP